MNYKELSLVFKALGDETRTKIYYMLKGGEKCACKLLQEFNITQPTLSYHMKTLVDSNLINVNKKGVWNYYSIDAKTNAKLSEFINKKENYE